uniref:Efflux RND transporter permease subunit n=1 Tax=Phenylobacterium glaciei TaxID=2803784 RepID=A0A974S923_9CAUL|nr:efflux RND transporter permease subunit [Phenylobacterium glaciei]
MARPRLDYEPTSPRLLVDLDRDKAATLGVSAKSVGRALETMFGSRKVTTYIRDGQEYDVILQTDRANRQNENDLANLYVRTGSGRRFRCPLWSAPMCAATPRPRAGRPAARHHAERPAQPRLHGGRGRDVPPGRGRQAPRHHGEVGRYGAGLS